jgi:hypothetical protein
MAATATDGRGFPMNAQHDNTAPRSFASWWRTPPRPGLQRIISPWEYRHLVGFARTRIGAGVVLVGLGITTLVAGDVTPEAVAWSALFLALAATNFSFGAWELSISRSAAAQS